MTYSCDLYGSKNNKNMDIQINFKDDLRCTLVCDRAVEYGIKDRFSFYAKGYKYHPRYKAGTWDGKISLYNLRSREFYVGLIPELYTWAKKLGYKIGFNESEKHLFKPFLKFDPNYFTDVVPKIAKFAPKSYQTEYVTEALKWNKLLILSPTGSGKSFTIYLILRYILLNTDFKLLINVPSISLVEQLFSDFKDYCIDGWDIDNEVTKVYGGQAENPDARVVISTWQSCKTKDPSYFQQFDGYICDEAHGADAKCITAIIENLAHSKIRIGLTGTLDGTDLHELEMIGRFGRVHRVVSTADLMESGDLADLKVNFLKLKYPIEECKLITKKTTEYQQEIDYILEHKGRNKLLVKLAMNQKKNTLMLFNYVDRHGKLLLTDLQAQADQHLKKIYFIYQKVKGDEREMIRKTLDGDAPVWYDIEAENGSMIRFQPNFEVVLKNGKSKLVKNLTIMDNVDLEWLSDHFKHGKNYRTGSGIDKIVGIKKQVGTNILLASYGTLAVGVNIKNLHTLIFCHPLKAKIRTLQSIGRILRTADGKGQVKLIDIVDDFSYTSGTKIQTNTTLKHFFERLKIYESESFKYDITEYKL